VKLECGAPVVDLLAWLRRWED